MLKDKKLYKSQIKADWDKWIDEDEEDGKGLALGMSTLVFLLHFELPSHTSLKRIRHILQTDASLGINYPNTRFVDLIPATLAQAGYESENLARSI